jgi:hypothetical protein
MQSTAVVIVGLFALGCNELEIISAMVDWRGVRPFALR